MAPGGQLLRGMFVSNRLIWSASVALGGLLVLSGIRGSGRGIGSSPPSAEPQTLRTAAQSHHLLMGTAADADHLSEKPYASILATEYSVLTRKRNEIWTDSSRTNDLQFRRCRQACGLCTSPWDESARAQSALVQPIADLDRCSRPALDTGSVEQNTCGSHRNGCGTLQRQGICVGRRE